MQRLEKDDEDEHCCLQRAEQSFVKKSGCISPSPAPEQGSAGSAHAARQVFKGAHRAVGTWHGACAEEGRALLLRRAREVPLRHRSWSQSHATLLASRAAGMRAAPSAPEAVLWGALVNRKLDGVAFRRQVALGGYICDFVAASHRLIVEVDGRQHDRRAAADAQRDRKLEALGYRVLRIPAQLVMRDLQGALGRVQEALKAVA